MPKDAPVNIGAPPDAPVGPWSRVSGMQAKLHRWAAADPGRRFDDLFNFVCDPATLLVAFDRVAGNTGAKTPGVDGMTVAPMSRTSSVWPGSWTTCETQLKDGFVSPAAGAGTQDPQARWVGEGAKAGHSDYRGSGRSGGAEAGAGTDFRGRLRAGLVWVSAQAAGARRGRGDSRLRHPRVIAGCWTRTSKRVWMRHHTAVFVDCHG